jgi:RimJ/RimL family protein N-acetyltransferase
LIVIGQKERVADFIEQRTGGKYYDYEAIGIEKSGVLVGGVLIYDYVENTRCAMSCAGDGGRWITREFLPIVFDYVFRQLQCKVVIITIESSNYKSLKLMNHIGFKELCRIKNAGTDCDLIVLEMQKTDCKYLTP